MTDLRKAAEMALEAFEILDNRGGLGLDVHEYIRTKIEALRQALAEPANSTTNLVEPKAPTQPDLAIVAEVGIWGEDLDEREDLVTNPANPVKNFVKREEKNA